MQPSHSQNNLILVYLDKSIDKYSFISGFSLINKANLYNPLHPSVPNATGENMTFYADI